LKQFGNAWRDLGAGWRWAPAAAEPSLSWPPQVQPEMHSMMGLLPINIDQPNEHGRGKWGETGVNPAVMISLKSELRLTRHP